MNDRHSLPSLLPAATRWPAVSLWKRRTPQAPFGSASATIIAALALAPVGAAQLSTEDAILTASDAFERSFFGSDIDVAGELAIVAASGLGSPNDITVGRAYLFDLATGAEISQLPVPQTLPDSPRQVMGVELVGDVALVGTRRWVSTPGYANQLLVYDISDPASPSLVLEFEPAGATFDDDFGVDIDAEGPIAVIGRPFFNGGASASGAALVVDLTDPASPVERGVLLASDAGSVDFFGEAVAVDAGRALVGAPRESTNASNAGAAYLFDLSDPDNPVELSKLIPPIGDANDFFGDDVALSGELALVSAFFDDDMGLDAGAVWVFDLSDPANPTIASKIVNPDGGSGDRFGWRVALDGRTAIVTEVIGDLPANDTGNAYVYDLTDPTAPTLTATLVASDADFLHFLGDAAAISGGTVLLGSERRQATIPFDGAVYVYRGLATEPCPGDTNGDGLVNADDLLTVLAAFGTSVAGGPGAGDLTADGLVNADDLLQVLASFGLACG